MTGAAARGAWPSALAPPLVIAGAALAALLWPAPFAALRPGIVPGLGLIMFAMGLSLRGSELLAVLRDPRWLLLGVALQFSIMPLAAFALARLLALPPELALGLLLVGACPGGTASNVMVYLARGNLALSVAMTSLATLLAPLATPLLMAGLAGAEVQVPVASMVRSIALVVALPVALGMLLRWRLPVLVQRAEPALPWLALAMVALIVASIVGINHAALLAIGGVVVLAVTLHHAIGLAAGYLLARALGAETGTRRALALEVGMQNSGLGAALAVQFFTAAAALPAAVFSVLHNLGALVLIGLWRRLPRPPQPHRQQPGR